MSVSAPSLPSLPPNIPPNIPPNAARPATHRPATRSPGHDVRSIPKVLRSEWIKLASVRSSMVILAVTVGAGFLVAWAVAALVTDEVLYVSEVGFYWSVVTAVLAAIAGILLFSSEAQHGTLATALAAQPARWVLTLAKALTAAAVGVVLGAAGLAAGFGGALISDIGTGDTSGIAATTLWVLLYTALSAVLGLGVGMIVRHSSGAIAGVLVWGFVVENLLNVFIPESVSRFLPFLAGNRLLAIDSDLDSAEAIAVALTRAENALVFSIYTAVALAAGAISLYRRDTT